MHTHSALRPPKSEGEPFKSRTVQGLTLRDVRMAMLLDHLFANSDVEATLKLAKESE